MKESFIFKLVTPFICFVFVMILCVWGFYAFLAFKAVDLAKDADKNGGLKAVIERVWCGEKGCQQ